MIWLAIWLMLVFVTGLVNVLLRTPNIGDVVTPINVALVVVIVGLVGIPGRWPARH